MKDICIVDNFPVNDLKEITRLFDGERDGGLGASQLLYCLGGMVRHRHSAIFYMVDEGQTNRLIGFAAIECLPDPDCSIPNEVFVMDVQYFIGCIKGNAFVIA